MSAANNDKNKKSTSKRTGNKKPAKMSFNSVADTQKEGEDIVAKANNTVETDLVVNVKAQIEAEAEDLHNHLLGQAEDQEVVEEGASIIMANAEAPAFDEDEELAKLIRNDVKEYIIQANINEVKDNGLPIDKLTDMIVETVRANEDLTHLVSGKAKEAKLRKKVKVVLGSKLTEKYIVKVTDELELDKPEPIYLASQNKVVEEEGEVVSEEDITTVVVTDGSATTTVKGKDKKKKKKKKEKYVSVIQPSPPNKMFTSVVKFSYADQPVIVSHASLEANQPPLPC